MARPKIPDDERPVPMTVRLSPIAADVVCRMALKRGISVYALLGGIIERVFEKQTTRARQEAWYGQQSSTLSAVLSESPSSRASRVAEPASPR